MQRRSGVRRRRPRERRARDAWSRVQFFTQARALAQLFGAARGLGAAAWLDSAAGSAVVAAAAAATGGSSAAQAACRAVAAAAHAGAPPEVLGDGNVAAVLKARCRDRPGLAAALASARPAAAAAALAGADPAVAAALAAAPAAADVWAPHAVVALAAGGPGADAVAAAVGAAGARAGSTNAPRMRSRHMRRRRPLSHCGAP